MGNLIPFDSEKFKAGQKALTRDGRVATFVGICEQCYANCKLLAYIEGNMEIRSFNLDGLFYENSVENKQDLVAMVTRHQHLIDSYDPEDTWQWSRTGKTLGRQMQPHHGMKS